ncbi:hypothetical protein ACQPZ2_12625 [Nocardia pseudovaccinii]
MPSALATARPDDDTSPSHHDSGELASLLAAVMLIQQCVKHFG